MDSAERLYQKTSVCGDRQILVLEICNRKGLDGFIRKILYMKVSVLIITCLIIVPPRSCPMNTRGRLLDSARLAGGDFSRLAD